MLCLRECTLYSRWSRSACMCAGCSGSVGGVVGEHKDKWGLVDGMVGALVRVGACYVRAGDAREARCYLLQGLGFSGFLRLHKRYVYSAHTCCY